MLRLLWLLLLLPLLCILALSLLLRGGPTPRGGARDCDGAEVYAGEAWERGLGRRRPSFCLPEHHHVPVLQAVRPKGTGGVLQGLLCVGYLYFRSRYSRF